MKVIGIDPGLIKTGWGIVEKQDNNIKYVESGTIYTNTKKSIGERLLNIYNNINYLIELYKPEQFAIEETFVNNNPITSLKLGQARGIAILTSAINNIPFFEYSPNSIKKSVTGVGKAHKEQIMAMIKYIFPSSVVKSEDEADALSVAICHCNHNNWIIAK
ncbi:MAG: crossover junction endodeoxyribonuclease RuvC [Rickettsiales bacterium]|jgi:crossover junction endodeoxyribonuclease RuvC|nr:crossover junction endodeoxyribonuclease RuvC [Rickettsiales bacterium]